MLITEENFVKKAENTIVALSQMKDQRGKTLRMVTTSQIRNLLAMSADIYNNVLVNQNAVMSREILGRIQYLKIRMVYEAGRTPAVKNFLEKAELMKILDQIGSSRENFLLFNQYMEALVAYHRYYGGKDN